MPVRPQSLLNYLQAPNPRVTDDACINGPVENSNSSRQHYMYPRHVVSWEDFTYDTLTMFSEGRLKNVLMESYTLNDYSDIPEVPFRRICDENSLDAFLIKWNQSIVTEALSKAQADLSPLQSHVYMVRGGQAEPPYPRWKPDWASVRHLPSYPGDKQKSLLLGDTKLGKKWSSAKIRQLGPEESVDSIGWMKPITQIFKYCILNQTRYGYIISDRELVVIRVRFHPEADSQTSQMTVDSNADPSVIGRDAIIARARRNGYVEYKAIPWNTTSRLTINLALWWLHLMAAGNLDIEENYKPLESTNLGSNNSQQTNSSGSDDDDSSIQPSPVMMIEHSLHIQVSRSDVSTAAVQFSTQPSNQDSSTDRF